ncbi:SDR family NAD(P)-dependent oxidoreductase [Kiloniella laminariae]|uniref:SDR family NAD(P)-dependent oxidoreductase n=1 Tax=Kiloniella laminariae TaxID=454162 RepID=A0ABT4LQV0_9PROT|nr:SDR family NAD(P)-dependent oxidoreductase [Kiloniella laminariae]MCZ4282691.1 SDR family NAD(P)-dependent oxidoreductase [Kiloniella laminariae]
MTELAGKSVLITGGGSGVGAVMALTFAAAGARVWIAGRKEDKLQAVAAKDPAISYVVADVTDEKSVANIYATTGQVDIVIANAGVSGSAPLHKTSFEDWQNTLAVNLTGTFLTFRDGLLQMPKQGGRLIAVASTAGLKGYAYVAPYAAAKHGVVGLVRALSLEVAKSDTTVNAICPGFLDTEMTERSIENIVKKTGLTPEKAKESLAGYNPQKRLIKPEEVAETALWLCRDGASSINGQAIALSGGEI